LVILATVAVVGLLAAVAGVRLLSRGSSGSRPDQARPGPVLLVPGYGGSQVALSQLAGRLRATGRTVRVLTLPDGGTGDLLIQVETLDTAVRAALDGGAPSVDVVGYSAGGVVAREWVRHADGAGKARRVLSVGSPQHGTTVAELAAGIAGTCPAACRQLGPNSDLLRALNARDETPDGPRFISVWSDADEVVVPPDSALLDGALNLTVQSVCSGAQTSHEDLPSDPVVLALLGTALGPGAPVAPADVPC
jgi:triacylglycerol lipase